MDIKQTLELHLKWLMGESDGVLANLGGANLRGANLGGANLRIAYLRGANLRGANLGGANLGGANLGGANLEGANLRDAYLGRANLRGANLGGANLRVAYLRGANLEGANLEGAYLRDAYLRDAYLRDANLEGASLPDTSIVPTVGPFTAFKKLQQGVIAELYVPRSAARIGGLLGRKCRVSKAKVKALTKPDGTAVESAVDQHTGKLEYRVGAWVKPDSFNGDVRLECTNGIHVFITRKEAEEYV